MAQHDYDIANASGATVRADINTALSAIATNNSGSSAPSTTFAFQWFADTATDTLKIRNAANSAYINVGTLSAANLGHLTVAGGTLSEGSNLAVGTTTGTKIGTATTQKLGFFNATPVVQPLVTADLLDSLQALGLVASGAGNTPLDLTGGTLTSGTHTLADASNIVVGTTTGTKIGTAATQKIGFYNVTPVVQGAAVPDITVTATTGTLPTANGSITIADAAAPTNAELLEYCRELESTLETLLARIRAIGIIA
jgi:hypothetical protein